MNNILQAAHNLSTVLLEENVHSTAPVASRLPGFCCAIRASKCTGVREQQRERAQSRIKLGGLSDGGPQARVDVARTSGGTDGVPSLLMERLPPRQQSRTRGSRVRGTLARRSSFFPGSGGAVTRKDAGSARDGRSENTPGASFFLKHRWEAPYQLTGWARLRVAGPSTSAPWWSRGYVLGVGSPLPMDVGPGGIFPDWC